MNRFDAFITVGWENIMASPDVATAEVLDPDDKGYAPPFRIAFRPPERSWFDAAIMNYCEALSAS
jgi:hypothetical protein